MSRFIAAAWDVTDKAADTSARIVKSRICSTFSHWQQVLTLPGLIVFSSARGAEERVYKLSNSMGVILGTLFKSNTDICDDSFSVVDRLSAQESAALTRFGPSRLVESYWGWYVAFIRNSNENRTWVFRGPMSDLPCNLTTFNGVSIFLSKVEDVVALRLRRFTIDWPLIQVQVGFGEPVILGQSAIRELSVIERGEAVEFAPNSVIRNTYWNPVSIVKGESIDDRRLIDKALKATTSSCVHAWASLYSSIILRLSGGLDSSIVLQCLSSAPTRPRVACINYYWDGAESDEREVARSMAAHVNAEIIETRFGETEKLDVVRNVNYTAMPVHDVIDWQEHVREHEIARGYGAKAVFMGSLGDGLFQRDLLLSVAADYTFAHGFGPGFVRVALDLALNQGVSIWAVMNAAFSERLSPRKGRWSMHEELLRNGEMQETRILVRDEDIQQLRENAVRLTHPWLRDIEGVPVGKLIQIAALHTEGFYDAHFRSCDDPRVVGPFLSQPLVELCLRIPSYRNFENCVERASARSAFARDLPKKVRLRTGKGSPTAWLNSIIQRDKKFVCEFLLDGLLVKAGVVDRGKLEQALPGHVSKVASYGGTVMNLLYTEAWLRAWSEVPLPLGMSLKTADRCS